MKHKWLIDAGHGGIKDGHYTTAPGKMFAFPDLIFYEGVNNREVAKRLIKLLQAAKIDFATVYDEVEDTPLGARVHRVNNLYATDKSCIFLSIHSDAMPEGSHGKGQSISVWTSVGDTPSDPIAEHFFQTYARLAPQIKAAGLQKFSIASDKMDGDNDKEQNFYVLKNTNCPALLTENLFYDNHDQAVWLWSEQGRQTIANILFECIKGWEAR